MLKQRFISCMQGALIGDCLGGKYEFEFMTSEKELISKAIDELEKGEQFMPFTDDTEMTRSIARSFADKRVLDVHDIATRFRDEYVAPHKYERGYGCHVPSVFMAHENITEDTDIFAAARSQFSGSGSYGNGSAMRCSPIALYTLDYDMTLTSEISRSISMITHTHEYAIEGALLECVAIKYALGGGDYDRGDEGFDETAFIAELLNCIPKESIYVEKLKLFEKLLKGSNNESEVIETLGNSVEAHKSVLIAIFCFMKALHPIPSIERDNPFERAVVYAISMGGDTDTIASMTGAIAGAYHTLEGISPVWLKICEGADEAEQQAVALFDLQEVERDDRASLQKLFKDEDASE